MTGKMKNNKKTKNKTQMKRKRTKFFVSLRLFFFFTTSENSIWKLIQLDVHLQTTS